MKTAVWAGLTLAVVWAVIAFLAGPRLIEAAYRGESFGFLNDAFGGRSIHPLGRYMDVWWSVVGKATVAFAVTGVAVFLVVLCWSPLSGWLARPVLGGRVIGPARIIACSAALGMSAGVLEVIVWRIRLAYDQFSVQWSNIDTIWAAPLLMAVFAIVLALPFVVIARGARRGVNASFVLTVVGAFCWYGLIRSARSGLHPFAVLVLACGLAVATQRLLVRRGVVFSPRFGQWVRAALGVAVLLSVFTVGGRAVRERIVTASLPAVSGKAANVILIIWDTVRAESLTIYGYPRLTTPEIARLTDRSLIFDEAIVPAPWTLPSHASMFTGLLPDEHGASWKVPLGDEPTTLAGFLRERGYLTGGFVANLEYTSKATGLGRGFVHYDDYGMDLRSIVGSVWYGVRMCSLLADLTSNSGCWRKNAPEVTRDALDWIDRTDRPFFIFMNYYDAHGPYEMQADFAGVLDRPVIDTVPDASTAWIKRRDMLVDARDRYDTSLAFLDSQIGSLYDELNRRGLLENTLIILSSDHGELFGEHGLEGHAKSLYDPVLRVPLVMVGPRLGRSPGRVAETAPLIHLPATVLDWLGFADNPFGGKSLLALGTGRDGDPNSRFAISLVTPNPWVEPEGPVSLGPAISVSWDRRRLIRYGDGSEVLYDLRTDPAEIRDLSDNAEFDPIRLILARQIDRVPSIADATAPRDAAAGRPPDIAVPTSKRHR